MNYLVTGVKKPSASVGAIVDGGNRVIFDADGSFIENKVTGELIALKRKDGTIMMEMQVGPQEVTPSGLEPTVTVRPMMQLQYVLEQWSRTMRMWRLRWRPG